MRIQWFHLDSVVVSRVLDMLIDGGRPGRHCWEGIFVDFCAGGFGGIKGCCLDGAAVDRGCGGGLICGMGVWLGWRLVVGGWFVVVFWLFVSAPTRGAAASAAAFTALIATAETIDDASQDTDEDDGADDDADDDRPSAGGK